MRPRIWITAFSFVRRRPPSRPRRPSARVVHGTTDTHLVRCRRCTSTAVPRGRPLMRRSPDRDLGCAVSRRRRPGPRAPGTLSSSASTVRCTSRRSAPRWSRRTTRPPPVGSWVIGHGHPGAAVVGVGELDPRRPGLRREHAAGWSPAVGGVPLDDLALRRAGRRRGPVEPAGRADERRPDAGRRPPRRAT